MEQIVLERKEAQVCKSYYRLTDNIEGYGGMFYVEKHTAIEFIGCRMENSNAFVGGLFYVLNSTSILLKDSTASQVSANYSGAIMALLGSMTILNSTLSNVKTSSSSAFAFLSSNILFNGVTVNDVEGDQGAIFASFDTVITLEDTRLSNMVVSNRLGNGGGLICMTGAICKVNGSTFENVSIPNYGGSVYFGSYTVTQQFWPGFAPNLPSQILIGGIMEIERSRFINSSANFGGAFSSVDNTNWRIVDSQFIGNQVC